MTAPFPDDAIIPARAEGILALRWSKLAEREGHTPKPPSLETQKRQRDFKKAANIEAARKANKRRKDQANAKALAVMGDKEWRSRDLAPLIGVNFQTARHRIRVMFECGLVELVREEGGGIQKTKIWRAAR